MDTVMKMMKENDNMTIINNNGMKLEEAKAMASESSAYEVMKIEGNAEDSAYGVYAKDKRADDLDFGSVGEYEGEEDIMRKALQQKPDRPQRLRSLNPDLKHTEDMGSSAQGDVEQVTGAEEGGRRRRRRRRSRRGGKRRTKRRRKSRKSRGGKRRTKRRTRRRRR